MPLLRKFGDWPAHTEVGVVKFADDIAVLAAGVAANRKQSETA